MRTKHVLWRVKNGWIRTPGEHPYLASGNECNNIMIFGTLEQFANYFRAEQNDDTNRTSAPGKDAQTHPGSPKRTGPFTVNKRPAPKRGRITQAELPKKLS